MYRNNFRGSRLIRFGGNTVCTSAAVGGAAAAAAAAAAGSSSRMYGIAGCCCRCTACSAWTQIKHLSDCFIPEFCVDASHLKVWVGYRAERRPCYPDRVPAGPRDEQAVGLVDFCYLANPGWVAGWNMG